MTKFLVLYKADRSARDQMAAASPEQAQAGMDAWMAWAARAGESIVDMGAPVTGSSTEADERVGGYSILQADSFQALQAVLDGHPHLQVGSIDVHEFLPMPGM
jgi:hypothetical protein